MFSQWKTIRPIVSPIGGPCSPPFRFAVAFLLCMWSDFYVLAAGPAPVPKFSHHTTTIINTNTNTNTNTITITITNTTTTTTNMETTSIAVRRGGPPPQLIMLRPTLATSQATAANESMVVEETSCTPMELSSPTYYVEVAQMNKLEIQQMSSLLSSPATSVDEMEIDDANQSNAGNCSFEHPGASRQNANPFSVLSGGGNNNNNNRGGFGQPGNATESYYLNKDVVAKDLTEERPSWILSAYGPGRDPPEQLWGGPIEQSFEEMRLHYMNGVAAGNPQGALSDIQNLWTQAEKKIQVAASNPQAAIDYIVQAGQNHPNRLDFCLTNVMGTNGEFAFGKRPIGVPFSQTPSAANSNGAFGQRPNPFSNGGATGFGQPSSLGASSTTAFGQPSQPASGFGQASTMGPKPNPFGQSSAFGQPSSLGQANTGFGQPSTLGAKPNPFGASAFGQPAQPSMAAGTGFGQPGMLGAKPNPFGAPGNAAAASSNASPFSAFSNNNTNNPANNATATGAFANTNAFSQPAQPSVAQNPFGQPKLATITEVSMESTPSNSFATTGNAAANPFGQPAQPVTTNPFGQPAPAAANPFGQPQPAQPAANPFSNNAAPAAAPAAGNAPPAAATATANPYSPNATRQHPPYESYAQKAPTGQLQMWKGQPIVYKEIDGKPTQGIRGPDGSFVKIWFPDGPPAYYKDTEPTEEYSDADKKAWEEFARTGKFTLVANGGLGMPRMPPPRELCTWDF